jgi:class 3 adenylate cyclase
VRNSFIGGFAIVALFAAVFLKQRNRISKEKKRSEELLLNILPEETAEELKATGTAKAKSFDLVSVMFTDFKNFTQASEKLSAEELVAEINRCYSAFDKIVTRYGLEKIKTIGDSYMCAGGLPVTNATHPVDIIKAGLDMQQWIEDHKAERIRRDQPYFELRLGIHTGPVVAGIVGIKKFAYDIWGDTVNTASRMESSGAIGKVNISGTTYEMVKDHFECTHRGKIDAKNKGQIDMYFVERALY